MKICPGAPYPLGATWDGRGVNFAIFSEHATPVDLCLFDSVDACRESHRIALVDYLQRLGVTVFRMRESDERRPS